MIQFNRNQTKMRQFIAFTYNRFCLVDFDANGALYWTQERIILVRTGILSKISLFYTYISMTSKIICFIISMGAFKKIKIEIQSLGKIVSHERKE